VHQHRRALSIHGLDFHWREYGTGAPVVLVHGLGVSGRYLLPTAKLLAADVRALVPDLPGFGRSAGPPRPLGLGGQAAALAEWLDAIDVPHASFLGNSMGCQTLTRLAVEQPGRVDRLVLVGPTIDPAHRNAASQLARLVVTAAFERPFLTPLVLYEYASQPLRTVATAAHALADAVEERLPRVAAPTLVVRGEHDALVPQRWAEEVARLLRNGRLAVVAGTGHAVNYSAPDQLARLTLSFLSERSEPASD